MVNQINNSNHHIKVVVMNKCDNTHKEVNIMLDIQHSIYVSHYSYYLPESFGIISVLLQAAGIFYLPFKKYFMFEYLITYINL